MCFVTIYSDDIFVLFASLVYETNTDLYAPVIGCPCISSW